MALLNSTVGLIYSLKAETSDAEKGVSNFRKHVDDESEKMDGAFSKLGKSVGLSEDQLLGLQSALPVIGAVASSIAGIATAAVGATAALFKLAQGASDFGGEIFDAAEITGLSAETLSALKYEADKSGIAFETVTGVISKFSKLVGEAARGSEEAKNKLKSLGVAPQEAINDLDGALTKVFARIVELPKGIAQMNAATDAFGKSGAIQLLPFLKDFNGDLQGLIETAKELGVTIDDGAAAASDEFGDSLKDLNAQIKGIGHTIGLEFMPLFLDATKSVSRWLKENRGDIKTWATNSADLIRGLIAYWTDLKTAVQGYADAFNQSRLSQGTGITAQRIFDPLDVIGTGTKILQGTVKRGRAERKGQAESELGVNLGTARDGYLQDLEGQKQAAEKLAQENQAAQERINKAIADGNRAAYEKEQAALIESYKERGITAETFNNEFLENERQFRVKMLQIIEDDYSQKRAREKNAQAKKALDLEEQNEREKIITESQKREEEAEKLITETVKKESEKQTKATEETIKNRISLYQKNTDAAIKESEKQFAQNLKSEQQHIEDVQSLKKKALIFEINELKKLEQTQENIQKIEEVTAQGRVLFNENEKQWLDFYNKELEKVIDKRAKVLEIEEKIREKKRQQIEDELYLRSLGQDITPRPGYDSAGNPTTQAPTSGIFGGGFESLIGGLFDIEAMTEQVDVMAGLGQILSDTFNTVAQAVGSAVRSFVLFGSAGGSFRKFAAEVIASVAQMAIVQAVWELAQGFAMLALSWFTGNPKYAASAGAHFQAAAVYGIVGGIAAVAGRGIAGNAFQQQASGSAISGSSGNNSQGNTNGGRAYSSSGDQVTTITNDRNQPQERRIKISLERGLIAEVIREDINSNGSIRRTLIDVVQGA